jgi:hypothetical protein
MRLGRAFELADQGLELRVVRIKAERQPGFRERLVEPSQPVKRPCAAHVQVNPRRREPERGIVIRERVFQMALLPAADASKSQVSTSRCCRGTCFSAASAAA